MRCPSWMLQHLHSFLELSGLKLGTKLLHFTLLYSYFTCLTPNFGCDVCRHVTFQTSQKVMTAVTGDTPNPSKLQNKSSAHHSLAHRTTMMDRDEDLQPLELTDLVINGMIASAHTPPGTVVGPRPLSPLRSLKPHTKSYHLSLRSSMTHITFVRSRVMMGEDAGQVHVVQYAVYSIDCKA